jgi:hypothetical protein
MSNPSPNNADQPSPPMTPERWRVIEAILRASLSCEPVQRDAFVAQAGGAV